MAGVAHTTGPGAAAWRARTADRGRVELLRFHLVAHLTAQISRPTRVLKDKARQIFVYRAYNVLGVAH